MSSKLDLVVSAAFFLGCAVSCLDRAFAEPAGHERRAGAHPQLSNEAADAQWLESATACHARLDELEKRKTAFPEGFVVHEKTGNLIDGGRGSFNLGVQRGSVLIVSQGRVYRVDHLGGKLTERRVTAYLGNEPSSWSEHYTQKELVIEAGPRDLRIFFGWSQRSQRGISQFTYAPEVREVLTRKEGAPSPSPKD